jgi:hypothetical protein
MIGEHKFVVDLVLAPLAPWSTRGNQSKVSLLLTLTDGSSLTWSAVRSDSEIKAGATYLHPFLFASSVNDGTLRCFTDSLQDRCLSCVCPSYNKDPEWDVWNLSFGLFGVHWYGRCEILARVVAVIDPDRWFTMEHHVSFLTLNVRRERKRQRLMYVF